jgi:cell division GTPase FtsZ
MPIKKKLFNAPVILSFGSGAGKILSNIETPLNTYKIAINSSARDLQMINNVVDEIVACGSGNGSGMDPSQGKEDINSSISKVFKTIDDAIFESKGSDIDMLPIIASLGHGFGSGSTAYAIEKLTKRYKSSIIVPVVITPFTWEGESAVKRAYEALKEIVQLTPCFIISNEEVGNQYKDIGASYDKINTLIGDALTVLLRAFSATDGILQTIDKNDFKRFFANDLATIRHMKIKSAKDLKFEDIKDNIGKRWLHIESKVFKPAPTKLNVSYILDGAGPFNPKVLAELQENATKKDYINKEYIPQIELQNHNKIIGL